MRYYRGADGEEFFYASAATIRCPLSPFKPDGRALDSYEEHLQARVPGHLRDIAALGLDGVALLRQAHRRSGSEGRGAGEPCPFCGATLRSIGYGTWRERPLADDEEPGDGEYLIHRFGEGSLARTETVYWEKKREAIEWAREESRVSREVAS